MRLIRWLSNPQWCFKVQYGAAMISLIIISLLGGGYDASRSTFSWSKDLISTTEMISTLELKESSKTTAFRNYVNITSTDLGSYVKTSEEDQILHHLPLQKYSKRRDQIKNSHRNSDEYTPLKDIINYKQAQNIHEEIVNLRNIISSSGLPYLSDIHITNNYWQSFEIINHDTMYLFSAFFDNRKAFQDKAFVRILSIMRYLKKPPKLFCQMWFQNGKRVTSKASLKLIRYDDRSTIFTYIIQCEVPLYKTAEIPLAVSLVERYDGNATNLLKVINNEAIDGYKKDFAVCVKGLDFPFHDISIKLVEWLELLNILGVSKVFFYEFNVHPNISKVLQYYTLRDRIEVIPLTLPGNQPTEPKELHDYLEKNLYEKRSQEKITYNDCFYRNIKRFKYIANLDIDEMLIPQKSNTWKDVIERINTNLIDNGEELPDDYQFERVMTLDMFRIPHGYDPSIPNYMYMLQNIYLLNKYKGGPKSIISTERVIIDQTHKVQACLKKCKQFKVPTDTAHILHYRKSCKGGEKTYCTVKNSVKDIMIRKYKNELIKQTTAVLKKLKLI